MPYENFLSNAQSIILKQIPKTNPFFPIINHELDQIKNIIKNLKFSRSKRSLDFIGTGWKWIAGSPDHDDFTILRNKLNNVIENNNDQITINEEYSKRINMLTNVTNDIINTIKKDSTIEYQFNAILLFKIKLIKEELTNIIYAIELAKENIVNSNIMSKNEINIILDKMDKEIIPYTNIEQAIKFADVKIASNLNNLLYIVNIPKTKKEIYEKIIVIPMKKNNGLVSKISYRNILRNKKNIYGIINKCKKIEEISICKQTDLQYLSNDKCVVGLLENKNALCNSTNSQHIAQVEELSQGLVILNQFNGTIEANNYSQALSGNYIVKFVNETIRINNQQYIAQEVVNIQAFPPTLHPNYTDLSVEEVLSLELMKDLHTKNLQHLNKIQIEKDVHQAITYGIFGVAFIIIMILRCKKKTSNLAAIPPTITITNRRESIHPLPLQKYPSLYNIM